MNYFCERIKGGVVRNPHWDELDEALRENNVPLAQEYLSQLPYDLTLYGQAMQLKNFVEAQDFLESIRQQAQTELNSLNPQMVTDLLRHNRYLLAAQPASHSRGHVARDLVHLLNE